MADDADLESQLIELQTQLAFQEDTLAALDKVVTSQQRQIDQLMLLCERLARQIEEAAAKAADAVAPETPPHY